MNDSKIVSEIFGDPILEHIPILHDFYQKTTSKHGDRIALVCMHQPSDFLYSLTRSNRAALIPPLTGKYLRWTFSQVADASHAMAISLAATGIKPGMRVMTFLNNGVEGHVMFRAGLELNCLLAPLNPKTVLNKEELRHFLALVKPSVLVVDDSSIAEKIESQAHGVLGDISVKILSNGGKRDSIILEGWKDFASFAGMAVGAEETALKNLNIIRRPEDVIAVLFTSGTTNLPKGCPYTNKMCSAMTMSFIQHMGFTQDSTRIALCHMATSHVAGLSFAMSFHCAGLRVVHASPLFDATASAKAIELEQCSDIPAVPVIIDAMLANPLFSAIDTSCIKHILFGATAISPEKIESAMEIVKACTASNLYGMTETGTCLSKTYGALLASCGSIMPGVKVRIRIPGSKDTVQRGTMGELHVGGSFIIAGYWLASAQKEDDAFYTDEHGLWFKTGDQAVIHEDGQFKITGRYKDIIIRGGENISPSAVESSILSRFNLTSEVVGVPDEMAGEVPVAVIQKRPGQQIDKAVLRETLVKEFGAVWVPEEFIDIEDLGISNYPRTSSGKVMKVKLREIVRNYRNDRNVSATKADLVDDLTRIWTTLLRVNPGTITPEASIRDWADSLIMSRFPAVLSKQTGFKISLQELIDNPTIKDQVKILSSRRNVVTVASPTLDVKRHGPPGIDDMVHAHGNQARHKKTQELCSNDLKQVGLSWDDVEDIVPMKTILGFMLQYNRPRSWNQRHAFLCSSSSVTDVQMALQKALTNHSILRTMAMHFDDHTPLFIAIQPSEKWFSLSILKLPSVKRIPDLLDLVYGDDNYDHACYPGPLVRFIIVHVQETNCAGIVYMVHHSVIDAISISLFLDDLDDILDNLITPLKPHVPYKTWADSYYNLRNSSIAKASVDWHVSRLRGISKYPAALFPALRAPQWFLGPSNGWIDDTGKTGLPRKSLTPHGMGVKGINGLVTLKDIRDLKSQHMIERSQIVRAALAVLTVLNTQQPYAIYGQVLGSRTWPFMLDWQANSMPPAMDVNGPTFDITVVKTQIKAEEKVIDMLLRLQREQILLTRHSCAPLDQIVSALNELEPQKANSASDDIAKSPNDHGAVVQEGDFMMSAVRRQVFNWLPHSYSQLGYKRLQNVQLETRADMGCRWNCFMLNETTLSINLTWDDAQLSAEEVNIMMQEILKLAESFAVSDNWNKTVGELVALLESCQESTPLKHCLSRQRSMN